MLVAVDRIVSQKHLDFVLCFVLGSDFNANVFKSVDEFFPVAASLFEESVSDFIDLNKIGKGSKVSILSGGRVSLDHQATESPCDGLIGVSLLFLLVGDGFNVDLKGLSDFLFKSHSLNNFSALFVVAGVSVVLGKGDNEK